jgi:zinc transport system ATP-binding protein
MANCCKQAWHLEREMQSTERNALVFSNLSVTLGKVEILHNVHATVPLAHATAIVGPNGAGKTTLINALLDQVAFSGQISYPNKPAGKKPQIGYVPQRLDFDRDLPLTVLEFMLLGKQRMPLWLGKKKRLVDNAREYLTAVKAEKLLDRQLGALSGGELQRVLLALAIQEEPELLVLDEPAAGVDIEGEQVICEFLDDLRRKFGFTQLMVSHDLGTVSHHADHVICLNQTVIAEGDPAEVFTSENLSATYGIHMGVLDRAFLSQDIRQRGQCCSDD